MNCCGPPLTPEESDAVSALVAERIAAFLKTLRDNAFAVGLSEGQDAALLMTAGYVQKPGLLRRAFKHLFSTSRSEWERFDGLFDAFWLGKRVRSRTTVSGTTKPSGNPSLKSLTDNRAKTDGAAATDQVPSSDDAGEDQQGEGTFPS